MFVYGSGYITISHSRFEGNAGNQIKVAARTIIDNSKIIGNCAYFNGKPFTSTTGITFAPVPFNNCRAAGNTVAVKFNPGVQVFMYNSTVTGHGDVLVQTAGTSCSNLNRVISKNNIYIGGPKFNANGKDLADLYYAAGANGNGDGSCGIAAFNTINDIIWTTKNNGARCTGNSSRCINPQIIGPLTYSGEMQDVSLKAGSPAIDSGLVIFGGTATDFNDQMRGSPWDIGALEFSSD